MENIAEQKKDNGKKLEKWFVEEINKESDKRRKTKKAEHLWMIKLYALVLF